MQGTAKIVQRHGRRRAPAGMWPSLGAWLVLLALLPAAAFAGAASRITGVVTDPAGRAVAHAHVELVGSNGAIVAQDDSDALGNYSLAVRQAGAYSLIAMVGGLHSAPRRVEVQEAGTKRVDLPIVAAGSESVSVHADAAAVDLYSPDPAEKVFISEDLLDANPGRPGAPVSIPGYPIETASGGIKAPQYFAPGVAGDHGEPIAQYIAVGGYLLPNNLSANAHGNGYADPNILIAPVLAYVQVNGGSYNVLEGNHSVNLAAVYGVREAMDSFLIVTGDWRDVDVVTAWAPDARAWIALEGSYGNGFLSRLEHRQQYKANAERVLALGNHRLTLFGIGYYGRSYVPGLVPMGAFPGVTVYANYGDTVDPRQRDQTHTSIVAANDAWQIGARQQVQISGFFRTYNLSLYSDFGQGLIRQSEFRTVAGGSAEYAANLHDRLALLAGVDVQREAPRGDALHHYNFFVPGQTGDGPAALVDNADVTILPVAPHAALQGSLGDHVHYYAGWRHDEIDFDNRDLVSATNSFHEWIGVDSPKATVAVLPGPRRWTPLFAASAAESFFTEDPRIGTGSARPTPVSRAHAYQLVASKAWGATEARLTLGQTTTGEQLAKIDPDTGLQQDQGPGRVRFFSASLRKSFAHGSILATLSKADARDLSSGQPTAEAPRTIADLLAAADRLPLRLVAKGEFEYVGANPLGTGCAPDPAAQCIGVAVKQFRLALARPLFEGRWSVGIESVIARGFTGQTLESFAPLTVQQPTGVRIPSYVSGNVRYRFGSLQSKP